MATIRSTDSGGNAMLPARRSPSLHFFPLAPIAVTGLLILLSLSSTHAFGLQATGSRHHYTTPLYSQPQNKKQSPILEEDDEAPAGIAGAEFFGGNKQKEEFYDEIDEQNAASLAFENTPEITRFQRFDDRQVFETPTVANLASALQSQINALLYQGAAPPNLEYMYASKLDWTCPLPNIAKSSKTPLQELEQHALPFYKAVDLAIVSGQQTSDNQVELQWELSVMWPTFWAPRILLLGSSTLTLQENKVVEQLDKLVDNGGDLVGTIGRQIAPRFWDWYHIGMTPSAELLPRVNRKEPSLFGNYQTYDIPARWVVQPTVLETGSREDSTATFIPNHAFSCIIKTMGPTRQRYVTTSPVEVQLVPRSSDGKLQLTWKITLSVEFQTNPEWPIAGPDEEATQGSEPGCAYVYQPRRKVATVPFGGEAQDVEISQVRKQLYEQVLKDGFRPKLDANGRPIFFFLQNSAKACYTNEGLGMCVYEWRAEFTKPNEVGIELELQEASVLRSGFSP